MKRYYIGMTILILSLALFQGKGLAQEEAGDMGKLFYEANKAYEERDYEKAKDAYIKLLEKGFESGNVYYNIGNAFLKLGKIGDAILYYEKARRLIPGDSDLKSNLAYARSYVANPGLDIPKRRAILNVIIRPFKNLNLGSLAVFGTVFYILVIIMAVINMIKPVFARRISFLLAGVLFLFFWSTAVFAIRYYDEEIIKRGIIIERSVDCKYEPIEQSTTFYNLGEGSEVVILKTRNGWCQIKRLDGKIAWVDRKAVGEI